MADLGSLEFQITSTSEQAEKSIDNLISRFKQLKSAISISNGTVDKIASLSYAINEFGNANVSNVGKVLKEISKLKELKDISIPKGVTERISEITTAVNSVSSTEQFVKLSEAIEKIAGVGKVSIPKSFSDSLKTVSDSISSFNGDTMAAFDMFADVAQKLSGVDLSGLRISKNFGEGLSEVAKAMSMFDDSSLANFDKFAESASKLSGVNFSGIGGATKKVSSTSSKSKISDAILPNESKSGESDAIKNIGKAATEATEAIGGLKAKIGSMLSKLADRTINDFKESLKSVAKNSIEAAKGVGKMALSVVPFSQLPRSIGNSVKKLKELKSSLMRIAMYRAIRTAMKELTEGLDKSIEAIYQFESAAGHHFGSVMDSLKTNATELTGNLGALAANIISLLAPALNTLMNILNSLISAFASLLAMAGGKVFVKATGDAQKYGDALKKGASSAKEWKNQILGFDEINRLEAPSDGGSGSGSGEINPYTFMEADMLDWMKAIQEAIDNDEWYKAGELFAEHFNGIVDQWDSYSWGIRVGEKIQNGLELALGMLDGFDFKTLGSKIATSINGMFEEVDGTTIGGIVGGWFSSIWETLDGFLEDLDTWNIGVQIGNMFNESFRRVQGAPIAEALNYALYKALSLVRSFVETFSLKDAVNTMASTIGDTLLAWSDTLNSDTDFVKAVVDWIDEVDWDYATSSISTGIANLLEALANKMKEIDKEKLKANIKEAFEGIDWAGLFEAIADFAWEWFKLKWELRFSAMQGLLQGVAQGLEAVAYDVNGTYAQMVEEGQITQRDLSNMIATASQYEMTLDQVYNAMKDGSVGFPEFEQQMTAASEVAQEAADQIGNVSEALSGMTDPVTEAVDSTLAQNEEIKAAASETGKVTQEEIGNAIQLASDDFNAAVEGMTTSLATFSETMRTTFEAVTSNITDSISTMSNSAVTAINAIISSINAIPRNIQVSVNTVYGGVGVKGYADGGYVSKGELFIARESGAEMVGSINGKTGVANNDQIVEGIRQGVFEAVVSAMSSSGNNNSSGNKTAVLQVNGKEFARAIFSDMKSVTNEHGISLINV